MGYTHYWYRQPEVSEDKMRDIIKDIQKVVPHYDSLLGDKDIHTEGIFLNGRGDEAHETFYFPRVVEVPKHQMQEQFYIRKGQTFAFCKTACKPYDIAVTTSLLIIKHHLGEEISVSSDGEIGNWESAIDIVVKELGYGKGFYMDEDGDILEVSK